MAFMVFGFGNDQWRMAPGVSSFAEFIPVVFEPWEVPSVSFQQQLSETWEPPPEPTFNLAVSETWEVA